MGVVEQCELAVVVTGSQASHFRAVDLDDRLAVEDDAELASALTLHGEVAPGGHGHHGGQRVEPLLLLGRASGEHVAVGDAADLRIGAVMDEGHGRILRTTPGTAQRTATHPAGYSCAATYGVAVDERWPPWLEGSGLRSSAMRQRYPAGATLFLESDVAAAVLVIQHGELKVSVTSREGREFVLDVLGPGDVVGELAALDGGSRSATGVALTDVEVLAIPSHEFRRTVETDPALEGALLMEVIRRLRASNRRQLEFGADALGRVCARLVELADRQGTTDIEVPVNQSELAAWTALSREAVVKALASMRRLGWIESDGRHVRLLEPDEVRARAAL